MLEHTEQSDYYTSLHNVHSISPLIRAKLSASQACDSIHSFIEVQTPSMSKRVTGEIKSENLLSARDFA